MPDCKLEDEYARLAALQRYEVLDTPQAEPFDKITSLVRTILNVAICAVSLVDRNRQWFKSSVGLDVKETPRDDSFCTHAIRTRAPMMVEDALLDSRFVSSAIVTGKPFIRSYLGVPLETPDGYNVGSLCVMDTVPRRFEPQQIEVLKSFAAVVVDELELHSLVLTDHLTGAATRRAFANDVDNAVSRFARYGHVSALVTFDLDHFKRINDLYGHATGDKVLRAVGHHCLGLTRTRETFGRLGGEEFGILLHDTTAAAAFEAACRFRDGLAGLVIPHEPPLSITGSFGIALLSKTCNTATELFANADRALYAAKRAGRNRCCFDGDESSSSPADKPNVQAREQCL
jgi:diguanylate cyclase (GGDEF)-like protein